MKTSYRQQYNVLQDMQSKGFNVCTCGNCATIILYNEEMKNAEEIECFECNQKMDYSDNPDYYYEGCSEITNEENG